MGYGDFFEFSISELQRGLFDATANIHRLQGIDMFRHIVTKFQITPGATHLPSKTHGGSPFEARTTSLRHWCHSLRTRYSCCTVLTIAKNMNTCGASTVTAYTVVANALRGEWALHDSYLGRASWIAFQTNHPPPISHTPARTNTATDLTFSWIIVGIHDHYNRGWFGGERSVAPELRYQAKLNPFGGGFHVLYWN